MSSATRAPGPVPIPDRTLGVDEEPPPYTPNPDVYQGESTVEYGPSRPHGPVPPRPEPQQQPHSSGPIRPTPTGSLPPSFTGGTGGRSLGTLWNQIREQAQVITSNINDARNRPYGSPYGGVQPQRPGASSWSSFPGNASYAPPPPPPMPPGPGVPAPPLPPRHPTLASRSHSHLPSTASELSPHDIGQRSASSEFTRDFYAVGDVPPEVISPGTGDHTPGKPTTQPMVGHPLLNDGQLLVYPKGYECSKCHNVGYRIPGLKPCRKCWPRYGKAFAGPLAYSYSSPGEANAQNLQRPLPPDSNGSHSSSSTSMSSFQPPGPPPMPPRPSFPPPPHSSFGRPSGGGYGPGPVFARPGFVPPVGSRVFNAGDSRIGGRRCWRCDGSGTVSLFFIDRDQCPICRGLGRTFN